MVKQIFAGQHLSCTFHQFQQHGKLFLRQLYLFTVNRALVPAFIQCDAGYPDDAAFRLFGPGQNPFDLQGKNRGLKGLCNVVVGP